METVTGEQVRELIEQGVVPLLLQEPAADEIGLATQSRQLIDGVSAATRLRPPVSVEGKGERNYWNLHELAQQALHSRVEVQPNTLQ